MLSSFKILGYEHIISIIIPIIIGGLFIWLAHKFPDKKKLISIIFAITIIVVRSTRYIFDIQIGKFEILDLLSLHVCHINLILLVICLIWPSRKLFVFNYLVGIPTALAVALMPGQTHFYPGMPRAILFIMSHMLLVMGAVYILSIYKFVITKKDILFYYLFSLFGIIAIYIFNIINGSNFMYLMKGPENTVLEVMYVNLGPIMYIVALYVILITLLTALYIIYNIAIKRIGRTKTINEQLI